MKRRLFAIASALLLALLLATLAVWVRSYYAFDAIALIRRFGDPVLPGHGYQSVSLSWSVGTISIAGSSVLDRVTADERRITWSSTPAAKLYQPESPWLKFRFWYSSNHRPQGWSRGTVVRSGKLTVPCWATALAAAMLSARWAARRWASRRSARGSHWDNAPSAATICA